jgi:hypothetical protein
MKTFFEPAVQAELLGRLETLRPDNTARWGRMDAAQMLEHCAEGMKMGTGELKMQWSPISLFGWMLKFLAYNDKPFKYNAPTAPELTIAGPREFQAAKAHFMESWARLAPGPSTILNRRHPFFGTLTPDQWGILLFKHLDHHFRQFGV